MSPVSFCRPLFIGLHASICPLGVVFLVKTWRWMTAGYRPWFLRESICPLSSDYSLISKLEGVQISRTDQDLGQLTIRQSTYDLSPVAGRPPSSSTTGVVRTNSQNRQAQNKCPLSPETIRCRQTRWQNKCGASRQAESMRRLRDVGTQVCQ